MATFVTLLFCFFFTLIGQSLIEVGFDNILGFLFIAFLVVPFVYILVGQHYYDKEQEDRKRHPLDYLSYYDLGHWKELHTHRNDKEYIRKYLEFWQHSEQYNMEGLKYWKEMNEKQEKRARADWAKGDFRTPYHYASTESFYRDELNKLMERQICDINGNYTGFVTRIPEWDVDDEIARQWTNGKVEW